MKRIADAFHAAISTVHMGSGHVGTASVGTGAPARPSRAKLGNCLRSRQLRTWQSLLCTAALMTLILMIALANATAETRPHYGGTLPPLLQSAPTPPALSANPPPAP